MDTDVITTSVIVAGVVLLPMTSGRIITIAINTNTLVIVRITIHINRTI